MCINLKEEGCTLKWKYLVIASVYMLVFSATVFSLSHLHEQAQPAQINTQNLPGIIIDAGHGGIDGGATISDGTVEKTINLQISKKMQRLFELCGFRVIMTRTDDILEAGDQKGRSLKASDIYRRLDIAESNPDCLFLSIHQNKFSVPKYSGAQVFFAPNGEESQGLALSIQNSIVSLLQKENERQIKPSGSEIYLLDHTTIPAVMVECGFLSNPEERALLKQDSYQDQMAFAILCGVFDYCSAQIS